MKHTRLLYKHIFTNVKSYIWWKENHVRDSCTHVQKSFIKKKLGSFCFHSAWFCSSCLDISYVYMHRHAEEDRDRENGIAMDRMERIHFYLGQCILSMVCYNKVWILCACTMCAHVFVFNHEDTADWYECLAYITLICTHLIQLTEYFQVVLFISFMSENSNREKRKKTTHSIGHWQQPFASNFSDCVRLIEMDSILHSLFFLLLPLFSHFQIGICFFSSILLIWMNFYCRHRFIFPDKIAIILFFILFIAARITYHQIQ